MQRTMNSLENLAKKEERDFPLPGIRTYKPTVIEIVWDWSKDWPMDKFYRRDRLETDPIIYGRLVYNKWHCRVVLNG